MTPDEYLKYRNALVIAEPAALKRMDGKLEAEESKLRESLLEIEDKRYMLKAESVLRDQIVKDFETIGKVDVYAFAKDEDST